MGQPDRDLSARRDDALARLAVITAAVEALEQALQAEPDLPDGTARALLTGARALCPAAVSTGTELAVSAGPDHRWTVFVTSEAGAPRLRLRRLNAGPTPAAGSDREAAGDVAGQLADLLRADSRDRW